MAFEMVEEALLQLKKEEAVEAERQRAATAATTQFAAIKSEVLGPIFSKAAALLSDEGLFAEITDQENDTTRSISLKVDLSTENVPGPQGSLICRLDFADLIGGRLGILPQWWRSVRPSVYSRVVTTAASSPAPSSDPAASVAARVPRAPGRSSPAAP